MRSKTESLETLIPKDQLNLYGYDIYFEKFINLFETNKLPNSILLSGLKGIGKSTFVYHFSNYLLSKNEDYEYSIKDFSIIANNSSYKQMRNNIHPNFFLIENYSLNKEIKIDQIRELLKFLNKSTYSKNLKIVLIDHIESLNLNSANALLKAIEEPKKNTFFFIIHNSGSKILPTIKSRCAEFKIFFSSDKKKYIFDKIANQYEFKFENFDYKNYFYFESPGNLIKYISDLSNDDKKKSDLSIINYFIEKYLVDKNPETLYLIIQFIQIFYKNLCSSFNIHLNKCFFNYHKILKQINQMNNYNLDKKNTFIKIQNILVNEVK